LEVKIPELMRGVGSGIKEFKDAVKEEDKKPEDSNKSENSNLIMSFSSSAWDIFSKSVEDYHINDNMISP
jgi:Sec-independent protein translocase protein TatA